MHERAMNLMNNFADNKRPYDFKYFIFYYCCSDPQLFIKITCSLSSKINAQQQAHTSCLPNKHLNKTHNKKIQQQNIYENTHQDVSYTHTGKRLQCVTHIINSV